MPTSHIWIGGAPAKAQVESITFPDDVEAGQTISFAIGVKTLEVPLTASTRNDIIDEVVTAWNASTIPEVAELIVAAVKDDEGNHTGVMTLTIKNPGKRFALTTSIGSGNNEIQEISLSGTTATGGTFTLTFDEETTGTIAYNASAATIKSALELLSTVNTVTVTGSGPWSVEFTGTHAGTNVSLMTIDVSNLTGGANEVQTISSLNSPTGGTFTLTYGGYTTAAINHNASAATIQSELESLVSIPSGDVVCSGGALPGTPVTVTFQGDLARTDVELLEVNSSLTGAPTAAATETVTGVVGGDDGLIKYWKFDESDATDNRVSEIDPAESIFVPQGAGVTVGTGLLTRGVERTNDAGDYLVAPSSRSLYGPGYNSQKWALMVWFKPTDVAQPGSYQFIFWKMHSYSDVSWGLRLNYDGSLSGFMNSTEFSFAEDPVEDQWNCAFMWIDGDSELGTGTANTQLNNGAVSSTTRTWNSDQTTGSLCVFGNYSGNFEFHGEVDECGIWEETIPNASLRTSLYNAGAGLAYPFSSGVNEVQTLTITGTPTEGKVEVSLQGESAMIPHNATASEAEDLLEAVVSFGSGNVNVTGGPWPGTPLVVEFIGDLSAQDIEMMNIEDAPLQIKNEVTTVAVTDPVGSVATTVTPLTQVTTTASEGPNDWSIAANWNTNTVPVTGDTVYISDNDISILYGLDQSAVTLAALHIEQTFTGFVGLPRTNSDGTSSYSEYRDQYLKIGATLLNIGDKEGSGSDRIKIDLGSVQSTVLITDSGSGEDENTPAILLLGTHANNVIDINRGSLGVAYYPTEASTIATLRQAFFDDATSDTTVYLGDGVTLTDIIKTGGTLDINSATTTFSQDAGETTIHAGAHTSLNVNDGVLNYNSTGTLTAVGVAGEAVLNFNQDRRPKTVTTITKKSEGSEIYDDSGCITAPIILMQNVKDLGQLHFSNNFTVTLT